MRLSSTLFRYFARLSASSIAIMLLTILALIFLADLVELLRRASGHQGVTFPVLVSMAAFQIPTFAHRALPFATLFGAIWTLARLTRSNELVVARAAGISVWQFLAPLLTVGALLGIIFVTLFSPVSATMAARFEQLEGKYLKERSSFLVLSSSGLWLRQVDGDNQSVIHAQRISPRDFEIHDVIIFVYEGADKFERRIDAETARLHNGYWQISDAWITGPNRDAERHATYQLPTKLTPEQIQESFAPPETLSFWDLPRFIDLLEQSGFSAQKHRLYWHSLMAIPLLLCATILIAATFSLRQTRFTNAGALMGAGVFAGFLLFVLSNVAFAFGLSGSLPAPVAAWSPAIAATLLGIASLFHLEDG